MNPTEGDLYDELIDDSYRLCRRMRTLSYWLGWVVAVIAVAGIVLFVVDLWPESYDDRGTETFFGTNMATVSGPSFKWRLQSALGSLTRTFGWAGLVAALSAGLRVMARRLELDLVSEYSDDE